MTKVSIPNRSGQTMTGLYDSPMQTPKGLCLLQHGYTGMAEQPILTVYMAAYHKHGFATLRLNATHSLNESDGDTWDWTATKHIHDLEDAALWIQDQKDLPQPLAIGGHSMGGMAALQVAIDPPNAFHHVLASAPVVCGKRLLTAWTKNNSDDVALWQKQGYFDEPSTFDPSLTGKVPWTIWEDWQTHDLFPQADKLTLPALFIVGANDPLTTAPDVKDFYDTLAGPKTFEPIPSADHMYDGVEGLAFNALEKWLGEIL